MVRGLSIEVSTHHPFSGRTLSLDILQGRKYPLAEVASVHIMRLLGSVEEEVKLLRFMEGPGGGGTRL